MEATVDIGSRNGLAGLLSFDPVREHNERLAHVLPEGVLRWVAAPFPGRVALATSLQAESLVLLDLAHRLGLELHVFTLDTGRLPQETYDLVERIHERYGVRIELVAPDPDEVAELTAREGPNLFLRSPELRERCCHVRKVAPLARVLDRFEVWVTGLRREQTPSRSAARVVELDAANGGRLKVNPLIDWRGSQVWTYIRTHRVPYHPFYDRGYRSIGCAPCTRAVAPDEDDRAGRWWWEDGVHKECGLHARLRVAARQEAV
jgi:thioredoxin-dependent adenylylsulfate APS reductase